MAQRSPTYTPDVSADTIDYKPLSPLAVAGILCAALYAALILIIAVADFFKGEPFFLPNATLWIWPIALPLGGGVLSALALWQIHNSEGTRAGAGLAKWGLGISLVAVLGYFTYTTFTELAIVQQANHFLTEKDEQAGFFPRLQGNDIDLHTAFLFTLDVADRGASLSTNAKDLERLDFPVGNNPKGRLTQFLENPLVKLVRFASPGSSTIEPLGVRGWSYEGGAYRVVRSYRITTEEAVFDVPVAVSSIEPTTAGEKRRWKVEPVLPTAIQLVSQTALGINRHELRHKSAEFVGDRAVGWLAVLRNRDDMEAYLRTQPFTQRKQLRQ
ncbi:MAG TPA: hypothetical protein VE988_08865, partial [Gemmataceae bacterium]|nr:hypothetical protein [Gemmataceae bacterium]